MFNDLRYGIRVLLKSPGFTVVATLILALGIGGNTAIFSVVNAVLLRPLSFPNPERLVQIWEVNSAAGRSRGTVSPHNFLDWRNQSHNFEQMAAYQYESFALTGNQIPEHLIGSLVSASFFQVMGVSPILGRPFLPDEDQPGKSHTVVLSHNTWRTRFGADPKVVGRTLTLNGEPYVVVGVMPPAFQFPDAGVELWAPPPFDLNRVNRASHFLFAIGRLREGISLSHAQAEANTIARRLEQQYPDTNRDSGILLVPLHEQMVEEVQPSLLILWSAVALVLLIACSNVANLLLARAAFRRKEIAIRTAVGASRSRLARQFLTESFLLAFVGGVLGLMLAVWGIHVMVANGGYAIPRSEGITIDGWVLGFTGLISIIAGIVFGFAPAFGSSCSDLSISLKESGRQVAGAAGTSRLRNLLVVSEVALALILLTSAGLLMKSFWLLRRVDPGFKAAGVLTMQLSAPESKYPPGIQRTTFFQRVIERVAALPGVESVGGVNDLPFSGSRTRNSFEIEGRSPASAQESLNADYRTVSPEYFKTMGIPLLKGRRFTARDNQSAPGVVTINQALTRRFWPDGNPLGKRLRVQDRTLEIVGIVGNLKHDDLGAADESGIYVPNLQGDPPPWIFLAVRSKTSLQQLVAPIRNAVREVAPDEPIYNVRPMEERLWNSIAPQQFNTVLLAFFATLALVLAGVGIYGVIAYAVTQRTHEIGVRVALGAEPRDVLKLVVGEGMILVLIGVSIGLLGAVGLTRFLASVLYGVRPTDPVIFVFVSVLLVSVSMLACYIPARRATKVDPMVALRYE
jgi:putative ABC transport system permease protein